MVPFRSAVLVVITAAVVNLLPGLIFRPPPLDCHGSTEESWESVAEEFREVLASQPKYGYSYSVYYEGRKVVDLYVGYADVSTLEPYRENTLNMLFSSTKGLSALCVALLLDRGYLDYKEKVAHYWPEFGVNGKELITVEMLLSHQAGLWLLDHSIFLQDIVENPIKLSKQLAEQKPLWEPGTRHGYHGFTITLYMNKLIRRADPEHRRLDQFFQEEFVQALGLDVHIGLPLSENYRMAKSEHTILRSLEDWTALFFDRGWMVPYLYLTNQPPYRIFANIKDADLIEGFNNPYVRNIPCRNYSGYGTARDLAKLMGILANGGRYNGTTLIAPEMTRLLTEILTEGDEYVMGGTTQFGRGVTTFKSPLGSMMFGSPGAGGQLVYGDLEHKLGFAFLTNKIYSGFSPFSPQNTRLLKATYDVVQRLKKLEEFTKFQSKGIRK